MIIKYSLIRLSIIFLLVIIFPFIQKQWLNLYLFDINSFSLYRLLYYLSGLIIPILVIINSLNKFTYYKFNHHTKKNNNDISGKILLITTLILLITLSILLSRYTFINLKIFLDLFINNNSILVKFNIDKQILFSVVISILLLFDKTKFLIKKFTLINFFIFSIISWYSRINNSNLIDIAPFNIFKFGNLNFLNVTYVLAIEIVFYLWSYISFGSYLSDWNVPKPHKNVILPIMNIFIFYFLIILYYSILIN